MVAIPFPVTSAPGKTRHESAGRLINAYQEQLIGGARAKNSWKRAPGLRRFATTAQTGYRGSILVASTLYSAFSGNVTRFDSSGTPTSVGTLAGTAKVFWARNNKTPTPDIVVVDPDNGASIVTAGSVTAYADPDLPAPNSVCFLDGYFFFTTGDGRCFNSDLNDTGVSGSFITCEGKPDSLLRAIPWSQLYLCGSGSIEVWQDTAEPSPAFPFTRSIVIPRGIIGRNAISGYEDGLGKGLIFVGDDRVVYALAGYRPQKISTPDVDRAIGDYIEGGGDANNIEMFPYVIGGHSCIVVKSPSWTWVLDLDTLHWHERKSYLIAYWRSVGAVNAFGKWIGGDTASGNLLDITETKRDEDGSPLVWQVESGPVTAFPNRMAVGQASFDIAQGVGIATGSDPTQTDPVVSIEWSDDAGTSWSIPRIRKLGRQSEQPRGVKVTRCGSTKAEGRRWRLTVSDAVDVALTGGDMSAKVLPA